MKFLLPLLTLVGAALFFGQTSPKKDPGLTLQRDGHWLVIKGDHLPGGEVKINYLEAYCRANSTDADWVKHTVIKHKCELLSLSDDGKTMKLRASEQDGPRVLNHEFEIQP